jgi:16S rRNA (guanine966-N2)-methyltransferase
MAKRSKKGNATAESRAPRGNTRPTVGVRIIGGKFRGRHLHYSGDLRTRPMKDRLREAIFNLIGPAIRGKHALDLFAGTGALGLEAISRGADRATLIEQHNPTANLIRQNIAELALDQQAEVVVGNTFIWWQRQAKALGAKVCNLSLQDAKIGGVSASFPSTEASWAVFCSPPYDFYLERTAEMLELIEGLIEASPDGSVFIVEADARFDFQQLANFQSWDVRPYPPAVVGVFCKEPDAIRP